MRGSFDTGRMVAQIYLGALEESKNETHAIYATAAWFVGMLMKPSDEETS